MVHAAKATLWSSTVIRSVNEMSVLARVTGSIITDYIQCCKGRDFIPVDRILIYNALAMNQIDFEDVFLQIYP